MNFQEFLQPKIYGLLLISIYRLNHKAMVDPMVKTASKNIQPFLRYRRLKIPTIAILLPNFLPIFLKGKNGGIWPKI